MSTRTLALVTALSFVFAASAPAFAATDCTDNGGQCTSNSQDTNSKDVASKDTSKDTGSKDGSTKDASNDSKDSSSKDSKGHK